MTPLLLPLLVIALGSMTDVAAAPTKSSAARVAPPLGEIAQRAARIALHTAGLSENDGEVERMATRARLSALLPELRVRVMDASAGPKDYVSDTGTIATSYFGATFTVEGSLTFHFDRLAYSGQEARLERLRLERVEARARITQRVIDELTRWSKARVEERDNPDGTEAHESALMRRAAAQMALDVWTAGWFSTFTAEAAY